MPPYIYMQGFFFNLAENISKSDEPKVKLLSVKERSAWSIPGSGADR